MKTIRQLREERGWSQRVVAEHAGVSVFTVASWERGLKTPRPHNLLRLARLFDISITDIALGPAEQHPQTGTCQERP